VEQIIVTFASSSSSHVYFHVSNNVCSKTTTTTTDGSVFTLGGSFSGGVGNKHGEIWRPETESWTYLPNVKSDGTFICDDVFGIQLGEYVRFDVSGDGAN
jgi:hypothetical protein